MAIDWRHGRSHYRRLGRRGEMPDPPVALRPMHMPAKSLKVARGFSK